MSIRKLPGLLLLIVVECSTKNSLLYVKVTPPHWVISAVFENIRVYLPLASTYHVPMPRTVCMKAWRPATG